MIRPAITFAREVNPFGVTKFIAHEVEVPTIHRRSCRQANELVQSNSAVCGDGTTLMTHVPIHIRICQAEDERLVTDQSLVVALGIANGLLLFTAIGEFVPYGSGTPFFIGSLLDEFDPEVGDIHREAIVKAKATIFNRSSQTWHTTYFLCYRNRIRVDTMDELIGQRKVCHSIGILMTIEVVSVGSEAFA